MPAVIQRQKNRWLILVTAIIPGIAALMRSVTGNEAWGHILGFAKHLPLGHAQEICDSELSNSKEKRA
ncbi:MAG: hypothetical protein M1294_14020 [Firmicutes bacterium]|nr:hypothetical protein [Bacillota bacterium]MCL5013570.1 hypothetical protein [Bacillota bacterium]